MITKKTFLEKVNNSNILFNEWFIKIKGKKSHFKNLKQEYFTFLNIEPFERFFLIEIDQSTYFRNELKELIFIISKIRISYFFFFSMILMMYINIRVLYFYSKNKPIFQ